MFNHLKWLSTLLLCLAAMPQTQAQTSPALSDGVAIRKNIAHELLGMQTRTHTDSFLNTAYNRFEWSDASKFITGTNRSPRAAKSMSGTLPHSFVYKLPTDKGNELDAVVWTKVAYYAGSAKLNDEAIGLIRNDGIDYAGLAGIDWHFRAGMIGAAVNYQRSRQRFISGPELNGNQFIETVSGYAYGFLGTDSGPRMWMAGGYGQGNLLYRSGRLPYGASADVMHLLYGGGLLWPVRAGLRNKLTLKAGIVEARLSSKNAIVPAVAATSIVAERPAVLLLPGIRAKYLQGRVALDTSLYFDGNHSAFWWGQINFGVRYEDGNVYDNDVGLDLMTSFAFQSINMGLTAKLYLQFVYMITDDRYTGTGGGMELSYDPAGDGKGISFTLQPTFGSDTSAASIGTSNAYGTGIHFTLAWLY